MRRQTTTFKYTFSKDGITLTEFHSKDNGGYAIFSADEALDHARTIAQKIHAKVVRVDEVRGR